MAVTFDKDKCTGCGACVDTCPVGALSLQNDLCSIDDGACADCGACVDVCPVGALSI
jgi:ferredoxin